MEYPEKIVTGAARALLNLFFDGKDYAWPACCVAL
jgi:hypothetical protein